MADNYREDLAYIHDAGFGALARSAAPVLLEDLRRRGVDGGLVIDLGCGSGILSEAVSDDRQSRSSLLWRSHASRSRSDVDQQSRSYRD